VKTLFFSLTAAFYCFVFSSSSNDAVPDASYSLIGTWTGKVDTIRASKIDTIWGPNNKVEKTIRTERVYPDVRFKVKFNSDQKYELSAITASEKILLKQYLKRFDLKGYKLIKTSDPRSFKIRFENWDKHTKSTRNYAGRIKFLDQNRMKVTVSLDDPKKRKTLILSRV
jgi:hypothetical protein